MKQVAIIGAGAAGLMAAQVLSQLGVRVSVYEQKPTAARKILMAGKTGLNISHAENLADFVSRYTPSDWIAPFVEQFHADDIRAWMRDLGIESFVGSTGRVFPTQMKASVLVRNWLVLLNNQGVKFHYRHACVAMDGKRLQFAVLDNKGAVIERFWHSFDAVILACGGGSYARLGSDGAWQAWFDASDLTPLYASNVGILRQWSRFMQPLFGQAIKRVVATVGDERHSGDIIISHYGLESGLIYRLNRALRASMAGGENAIYLDLLPDQSLEKISQFIRKNKKQSLNNTLRKLGLDAVKIAILRECTQKTDWSDGEKMAQAIKHLPIRCEGFRPMDEAISTGGGVRREALNGDLQLLGNAGVFCAGEMLDWDAPTGGYLLTACLATGRAAAFGVARYLGYDGV